MAKRAASNELNHENWREEEEPESAGVFKRANADDLKTRQFRTARRRGVAPAVGDSTDEPGSAVKSVFAGFSGFKKVEPASSKAVFSFLAATPNGSSPKSDSSSTLIASKSLTADADEGGKKSANGVDAGSDAAIKSTDKEYYRRLKGLNESVSKWISTHVANNPLIILTPVFQDYEKHLANIQNKDDVKSSDSMANEVSGHDSETNSSISKDVSKIGTADLSKTATEEKKSSMGSLFGSTANITAAAAFSFAPASSASNPQFSFGTPTSSNTTGSTSAFSFGTGNTTSPSAGFSFGAKPFTFPNVASTNTSEEKKDNDDEAEEDTPPKPDHKPVNEDGATYTKRCKVFVKQGKEYSDRGIGNLFLKPVDGGKTQLIVRADTSLGNVLLNILIGSSLPIQRIGANNVAVVCIPTPESKPPPVTVLLRVKTSDDADELFNMLEKHKKEAA